MFRCLHCTRYITLGTVEILTRANEAQNMYLSMDTQSRRVWIMKYMAGLIHNGNDIE